MHLKFKSIEWDNSREGASLMYVEFDQNGRTVRWYPKWRDIAELLDSTFATESGMNQDKLIPYLTYVCLDVLMKQTCLQPGVNVDIEEVRKFREASVKIKESLLKQ